MDQIIMNAFAKYGRSLGTTISSPYFFLKRELDLNIPTTPKEYQDMKDTTIRHLTISGNRYYDYIVDKYYDTLKEWANENDSKLNDVMFGMNRLIGTKFVRKYDTLGEILKQLDDDYSLSDDDDDISKSADSDYEPSVDTDDIVDAVIRKLFGMKLNITITINDMEEN